MNVWKVTTADRDEQGKIIVERRLSDLLPTAAPEQTEATRPPLRLGRVELAAIVGGLILALALIVLINRIVPTAAPGVPVLPTAASIPGVAAEKSTSAPTASPTAATILVVGWAAPGGAVLGPVPLPAAATARYGDDWIGFPWSGGMVWVRRSDWPTAPLAGLPDLTPPTPAPIVVWQPAPAIENAPAPTTASNERPSDKPAPHAATPLPPMYTGESLEMYLQRLGMTAVPAQQVR